MQGLRRGLCILPARAPEWLVQGLLNAAHASTGLDFRQAAPLWAARLRSDWSILTSLLRDL
jgi:hypothetical protein